MIDYEQLGMKNYSKYAQFTKERKWEEIFKLNEGSIDTFGTKKELKVLANYLEADEVVFALCSGIMGQTKTSNKFDFGANTWLIALTSKRFLCLDHALLTLSVDTQSIRHEHVQAVSASQGWIWGKIILDLGSRTIVIDNCKKDTVKIMASLSNTWLSVLKRAEDQKKSEASAPAQQISFTEELQKLAELKNSGILSEEEFKQAKDKILSKL